jgi:predicted exporter
MRLTSPESSFTEPLLRRDPLGFGEEVLQQVLTGNQQFDVALYRGRLLSTDRRHAMALAEPRGTGMDVAEMERVVELARGIADDALADERFAGLGVEVAGGPVYSLASANVIRRDVKLAMGVTAVGILLIFVGFFRNLRVMAFAYAPPVLGVGAGVAALGYVYGGAHGLSMGFGAAMLGITVDYTIHLFTRIQQAEAHWPREEALRRTLAEVTPSLSMGCLTTLIGFGALMISDTKALRDMSLMALGGIATAFALCAVVMPVAYRKLGGARRPAQRGNRAAALGRGLARLGGAIDRRPLPFALGWGAMVVLLGVAAAGMSFDGDIRNLDYQPPEVRALDLRFQEAFGAGMAGAMVVVDQPTLEQALAANEQVAAVLDDAVDCGELASFSSTAPILPSLASQRERSVGVLHGGVDALVARVESAAAERGFVEGYFQPFADDLRAVDEGEVGPLGLDDLSGTAVGSLLRRRVGQRPGSVQVLTLVETADPGPGAENTRGLEEGVFPHAVVERIQDQVPGTLVISFPDLAARLLHRVKADLLRLSGVCGVALSIVLLVYYRRLRSAALALLPCVVGFVSAAGLLSLLDMPLNMINVCGVAICLGVCIDYGVFVVDRLASVETGGLAAPTLETTGTGVLMSSLTTMVGLGTMAMARNPSMSSMGLVVIFGVLGGLVTALIGVPSLVGLGRGR